MQVSASENTYSNLRENHLRRSLVEEISKMSTTSLLLRATLQRVYPMTRKTASSSHALCRLMSSDPMPLPSDDLSKAKVYPEKINQIVDQIEKLTLLEVSDLNELLKVRNLLKKV